MRRHGLALCLAFAALGAPARAADAPLPLRGIGFEEPLEDEARVLPALQAAGLERPGFPLFVHIPVSRERLSGEESWALLSRRLDAARSVGAQAIVTLEGMPTKVADNEPWREFLARLSRAAAGRVRAWVLGQGPGSPPAPDTREYAFLMKASAVELRGGDPGAVVLEGHAGAADPAWLEALLAEETAAYLDGVALADPAPGEAAGGAGRVAAVRAALDRGDASAAVLRSGVLLGDSTREAPRVLLINLIEGLGSGAPLTIFRGAPAAIAAALRTAQAATDLLGDEVVTLDAQAAALRFSVDGVDRTATQPHRLLMDVKSGSTLLAYWGEPGQGGNVTIEIGVSGSSPPQLRDPATGKGGRAKDFTRDARLRLSRVTVPVLSRPVLLEFAAGAEPAGSTTVRAEAGPSVEEIVVRHQATEAGQRRYLHTYSANARMAIHFRVTTSDAGYDVVTENRFYWDRGVAEWEELSFQVNGARWGSRRPAFPILQPERVLSLPLDLQLDRTYRYRLEGEDEVDGRKAWVVSFDPQPSEKPLYRGRVWIDQQTAHRLKVQAVQTRVEPPITSNEEIQTFGKAGEAEGHDLRLLTRLVSRQLFLVAGRTIAVERTVTFDDLAINDPGFAERRGAAHASDRVMMRDTDKGLRYLVKRGGERVVSEKLTSNAKAVAVGTTYDPSYDFPLPIAGLNYLNFDFLKKDMQLAVLFGGVLAYGNLQKPRLFQAPLDISIDFFGLAINSQDRVFGREAERQEERVRTRPLVVALNTGWQMTSFAKLIASYGFRYDHYTRDDSAAAGFVTPSSTTTHALWMAGEYKRGGYSFAGSLSRHWRASWRPWGDVARFDPSTQDYWKWSVTGGKDFSLGGFHKLITTAGWYGGRRLDRFSRYTMGSFDDTRIRGVPSSAVRFSEIFLGRVGYTFNLFEQYRLELQVDYASGKDPELGGKRANLVGVGLVLSFKGPWNTILRTDLGKSFLPASYRGAGSFTAQVLLLKPL